jgi:uncharacterized protein YjbI with pentapeptide repeats
LNQKGATVGAHSEKVRQGWRKIKPYLPLAGVVLVAGAIWALIYVPKMQVPVCHPDQSGLPPKICFDIENEARRTLAYILGGILAIIGITLAHRRIRALERQVLVAQEGQITERFTRAIDQLGHQEMAIRLGGIYALERIANDSDKDYWTIMETLTAYVRERAQWREPPTELVFGEEESLKPATDIQAVLTIICRRKYYYGNGEIIGLDLKQTDLRKANLREAHLEGANLQGANLERASLFGTCLRRASLRKANLNNANLGRADLEEASLSEATLNEAALDHTNFRNAVLRKAQMEKADLSDANLERARLNRANLKDASFEGASLKGAFLHQTNLKGADLSGVIDLIKNQLAKAIMDDKTELPDYLKEKPKEVAGEEENKLA